MHEIVLAAFTGLAGAVLAYLVFLVCFSPSSVKRLRPRRSLATTSAAEDEGKKESKMLDIEDLMKRSLVPITLKQMKGRKQLTYSVEHKIQKRQDLEDAKFVPNFRAHLMAKKLPLKRKSARVMQLNIGLYCNQACTHCHVDSTPKRGKEMMTRETADHCLRIIRNSPSIEVVDLTGGAPELNREFRYLVTKIRKMGIRMIDRCNLTVLLEPTQKDLAQFLWDNGVHVIASLPCYLEDNVNGQRGDEVFARSIRGLQLLNKVGYGDAKDKTSPRLDLVYNPTGVHLPPSAAKLEVDYKRVLKEKYDIGFDRLIAITNMPINRFYDHLKAQNKLGEYMRLLFENFNPSTCGNLMCLDYMSVSWDGYVFDCDFNQQIELTKKRLHVKDMDSVQDLLAVPIATAAHCYGCTAGNGSS